jgi:hypothetical protein
MTRRHLLTTVASLAFLAARLEAEERLVFISAFAGGDKGAIHACELDLESGKLKLVHKTTGAENSAARKPRRFRRTRSGGKRAS